LTGHLKASQTGLFARHMVFNPFRRFGAIQYAPLSTFQNWMPTVKADELIKGPRRRIWLAILLISFALFVAFVTSLRLASLPPLAPKAPDHQVVNTPILGPDPWPLYLPAIPKFHLPEVARYNTPALDRPRTPLFIGFTRNRFMLQQTVLSYIAAGWPRTDIIVVDNSGTLDANERSLLSDDNPFQLDYHLLRSRYGVSILQVPTLLNFAQLQNFFLRTALSEGWDYYFWSHMDIAVLSYEDRIPYRSFYDLTLGFLRDTNITNGDEGNWAIKFFDYDHLTLINVHAWRKIGQWDTFIPYYATDCDAYSRVRLHGYVIEEVRAGHIFDIAATVSDLESKFFPPPSEINVRVSTHAGVFHSQQSSYLISPH
jgi:hypothetical protein